jgi:hypothetical protein
MEDEAEYLEYYKTVLEIIDRSKAKEIISAPIGGGVIHSGGSANALAAVQNDPSFISKVKQVANNVKCNFTDLLGLMEIESAGTFSPSIFNGINHYGLIQFADSYMGIQLYHKKVNDPSNGLTAKNGLTRLTRVEQMDYVEGFLMKWKTTHGVINQTLSASDLYTLVFLPGLLKKPDSYVFASKNNDPNGYWSSNRALRDTSKPDQDIWKGYLGKLVKEKGQKYSNL